LKRHVLRGLWVAGTVAIVGLAAFVYRSDSVSVASYRPASAVAVGTDGSSTESPYNYRVGDRLCSGSTWAAIDPGSSLTVYYDPNEPCASVSISPADKRLGDLVFCAVYLAAWIGVIRLAMRQQKEMTWQAS